MALSAPKPDESTADCALGVGISGRPLGPMPLDFVLMAATSTH